MLKCISWLATWVRKMCNFFLSLTRYRLCTSVLRRLHQQLEKASECNALVKSSPIIWCLYIFYPKSENNYDIPYCIFYSFFCIALRECLYALSHYLSLHRWKKKKNSYNSQGNKKSEYCKLSEHDLIIYARYFNAIFVAYMCKLSLLWDFARNLENLNNSQLYGLAFCSTFFCVIYIVVVRYSRNNNNP